MGKYKVVKKLGQGSYGTVYLVQDSKDDKLFVMKKITVSGMSEQELADCKKEIQILSVLKHPFIVKYKRSFVRRGALCIVMEYADGGDLHARIKEARTESKYFDEDTVLDWFTQACLGLKHVHDHHILHRDLKTQNIFLTSDGSVRLGDFGISRVLKNTMDQAHTLVGTPYYLSPEMVNGQPYDHRSDIWSMGVVLYEMLTLQHPFNADSLQMLALKIIQGNYPPIPSQYSPGVNELLTNMLQQDVRKRLDCDGVLKTPIILERVRRIHPESEFLLDGSRRVEELKLDEVRDDSEDEDGVVTPSLNQKQSGQVLSRESSREAKDQIPIPGHGASPSSTPVVVRDAPKRLSKPAPKAEPQAPVPEEQKPRRSVPKDPGRALPPIPKTAMKAPPRPPPRDEEKGVRDNGVVSPQDDSEWDSNVSVSDHSKSPAPRTKPSTHHYQEPSVARNTQVDILKQYLEERIGAQRLRELTQVLESNADDQTKQAEVARLTEGNAGLLPIVHTLVYLSKAQSQSI